MATMLSAAPNSLAHEFAGANISDALARPPWHVGSTAEIAAAAQISFGRLNNWICRRQFVPPEPRHLFRLKGNRSVFRLDRVTRWLSHIPLEQQARHYLGKVGLAPPRGVNVWQHVQMLERSKVFPHTWRPRDLEAYLRTL